jgi:hypothetical protein
VGAGEAPPSWDYMQVPVARPMGVGIEVRAITKGGAEVVVEIALTPIQMTRMILAEIDPVVEAT